MTYLMVNGDQEAGRRSSSAPAREGEPTDVCRPSTLDVAVFSILGVASVVTLGLMLTRDLTAAAAEPCDVLTIAK